MQCLRSEFDTKGAIHGTLLHDFGESMSDEPISFENWAKAEIKLVATARVLASARTLHSIYLTMPSFESKIRGLLGAAAGRLDEKMTPERTTLESYCVQ